jgi:hypothetical protein
VNVAVAALHLVPVCFRLAPPAGVVGHTRILGTARARNLTPAAVRKQKSRALEEVGRGVLSFDVDLEGAALWLGEEGFPCDANSRASVSRALAEYVQFRVSYELADLRRGR